MTTVAIDHLLSRVAKPARYTGGEFNSVTKDWDAATVRFVLAYPDAYDIGMSNMGIGILYDILNKHEDVVCERVFAPWDDMEQEMRREGTPLWSLETRHPVRQSDISRSGQRTARTSIPSSSRAAAARSTRSRWRRSSMRS
jgi:hypothetical protein